MKFSCTQENLYSGLGIVSHVTGRNVNLPILNNILLRTTKLGLEMVATNLEVAVVTTIRGKTEEEGAITVNGKLFTEAISLLPKERVDLELKTNDLLVRSGRQRSKIHGVPTDDFPVIPEVNGKVTLTIPATEFVEAVDRVIFAVNSEENRPEIGGVFINPIDKKLVLVGTDSYRLAEYQLELSDVGNFAEAVIVPLRAIQEVARAAAGSAGSVEMVVAENQILFRVGDSVITSRLVAGQYPDYKQIIPQEFRTKAVVAREDLLRAVRAAGIFVRSSVNDVRLVFSSTDKVITVSSLNSQLGENSGELVATELTGDDNEVVFNFQYLLEGLQAITTPHVSLELVSPTNPGALRPVGQSNYLYIIMPIRQ